jgi:hypothetical protein
VLSLTAAGATRAVPFDLGTARFSIDPVAQSVALAEGFGSFSGGAIAAELAVDLLPSWLRRLRRDGPVAGLVPADAALAARMTAAFRVASERIALAAELDEAHRGCVASALL